MLRARDLLERLRPLGTPGPAASAGVPVDRLAGIEAELAPVFAALADAEMVAARIVAEGLKDAQVRRDAGITAAADVVERARTSARSERAAAAAARSEVARSETEALQRAAERTAAAIGDQAGARLAEDVATVLSRVRADIADVVERAAAGSGRRAT